MVEVKQEPTELAIEEEKHKRKKEKKRRRSTIDGSESSDDNSFKDLPEKVNSRKKKKKKKKHEKKEKRKSSSGEDHDNNSIFPSPSSRPLIDLPSESPSPFRSQSLRLEVSLPPHSLSNIQQNVKKSIRSLLLRYDDGMGGVLLAFWNVKLDNSKGRIMNELPHVHFDVTAEGLIFCPAAGMKLTGVVNECFPSHVGLLVYSFFNAMISSHCLRSSGYEFDLSSSEWRKGGGDTINSGNIAIGDEVKFEVEKMHECAGVISLEGKL